MGSTTPSPGLRTRRIDFAEVPVWLWIVTSGVVSAAVAVFAISALSPNGEPPAANGDQPALVADADPASQSDVVAILQSDDNLPNALLWRNFSGDGLVDMADFVCRVWSPDRRPTTTVEAAAMNSYLEMSWDDVIPPFEGASRSAQVTNMKWKALEHHCGAESFAAARAMQNAQADELLELSEQVVGE